MDIDNLQNSKKLLACAKCYKLHRKCTGESRPCDYCKERKLECVENPDRKKRGRPKGSKNKFKSNPQFDNNINYELQNIIEITRKRNLNPYAQNIEDPRSYLEYQKRQKIISSEDQNYPHPQQQQYLPIQYTISNNNNPSTIPTYINQQQQYHQEYYVQNNPSQYMQQGMIPLNNNIISQQGQEMIYVENTPFPTNEFQNTYPPSQYIQQQEEEMNDENQMGDNESKGIPINTQSITRDLVFTHENLSSPNINNNNATNMSKFCSKCHTEMHSFKFCPHCGTPREKIEQKSLVPSISRRKLLSLAILEIVNENNQFVNDRESSQHTIWFVVRHPRINTSSSSEDSPNIIPSSPNIMSDFSLFNTIIKQVSPNWTSFLGYKQSESEKIPLSKFIPSKVEASPKITSYWESLTDHTSRNSTINMSCEFVLCHKFGLMFGVELQITCFANNGLPDTSFIVVKKHWNLMNTTEASQILNNPNIEYLSDKAIMDEEEDESSFTDPNFELLRKAVDVKKAN